MRKKRISADNKFPHKFANHHQSSSVYLGHGKYVDCEALMAKVEKQDPQRIVLREVRERTT